MQRIHPGLLALSVTAFAIGMAEFIVVGILPEIATALSIDLPRAGNLVGLYALALALGTPLLVMVISGLSPKPVLIALIVIFLAGSMISAMSGSYALFLAGRLMTAVAHGSFFAIGATVAARIAPTGKAGKAIAVMFAGLTLAMVIGVPLGSLLGQIMGWRVPLMMVSILAFIALLSTMAWLPDIRKDESGSVSEQLRALLHPAILTMMVITILGFGASFAAFTFVIPILTLLSGFSSEAASILLMVFGLATLVGNVTGGHFSSTRGWGSTLGIQFVLLAVSLIALAVLLPWKAPVAVLLFLWGALAFGVSPAVQQGMLSMAERYTPQAVGFASALNISAFNLGIFFGESIGAALVHHDLLAYTPWAGTGMCLLALFPLWFQVRYTRRHDIAE
ncbi:MFS transporter [Serratia proteamaculans]|uniref:MFS transporter n=1 Tax=Serratia proteamaculans TaxID=28151 RepID=UPI0010223B0F|nr:MFS transporter [Serratia proteamaculans]RYM47935.1 MFS transporter [Serratia proteamaculans]